MRHGPMWASFVSGLTLLLVGCGESQQETNRQRDAKLTSMLVGTWLSDTHYQAGYRIGDGRSREIEVWTFNPDGTWSSFFMHHKSNTLLSIIVAAAGSSCKGKWYVHNQRLETDITGSNGGSSSQAADAPVSGKPYAHGTGSMRVESEDKFWIEGIPFYRNRPTARRPD